ncbi:MAG TPA: hypothetical protein VNI01_07370 [Elusimicrobiota bacterium]|nr:hypothetical protein [Elusimicrobiota bacterium]
MSRLLLAFALVLAGSLGVRAQVRLGAANDSEADEIQRYIRENPDFGSAFTRECENVLARLETTREHSAFVSRRREVGLVITDTGHDIKARTAARYARGGILLNRTYLVSQAVELEQRGLDAARAAEFLAWKAAPIIAHEIRHGIVEEQMRRALGVQCGAGVLEDEILAFYDNARVAKEAVGLRPDLWEEGMLLDIDAQNGTILARWNEGPQALAELVRETYPTKISVREAGEKAFLRALKKDEGNLRDIFVQTARDEKILKTSTDPAERERAQAYLDSPPSAAEARVLLKNNLECAAAMRSAEGYEGLRAFYVERLAAARKGR